MSKRGEIMSLLVLQNGNVYHNKHVTVLNGDEGVALSYSSGDHRKTLKAIYLTGDKDNKLFETLVNALKLSIKNKDVNSDTLFNLYTHLNELSGYTLGEVVFSCLDQTTSSTPVNIIWCWGDLIKEHHRFVVSGAVGEKYPLIMGVDAWTLQARKTRVEKELIYNTFINRITLMDYLSGINQYSRSEHHQCMIEYMHLLFGSSIELKEKTLLDNLTKGI